MPTRGNNTIAVPTAGEELPDLSPDSLWTSVFDSLPEGISVHSPSGRILWANKKLCDLYDKSLAQLRDLSCQDVFHNEGAVCPHDEVISTGTGTQVSVAVQRSGRSFKITIQPLFDNAGKIRGFSRYLRDETSERRSNMQLRQAEYYATLGQLMSGIAHDVGTPLNVISGYAEFLLMRTQPEGQGHKELTAILEQTRRIAAVFSQALDLSKPSQGRVDAIEIKALLADSLVLAGHHLRKTDVKAAITCTIAPPLIYGEAPLLRQVFFNLLTNAAQQVGSGGELHIQIGRPENIPGFVGLTFEGTGSDEIAHDFSQSFGGFVNSPEGDNLGIGLYLSRKILDEAGAKTAFTEPGEKGIGMTVCLPIKPPPRVLRS